MTFQVKRDLLFRYDGQVKLHKSKDLADRLILKTHWVIVIPNSKDEYQGVKKLLDDDGIPYEKRRIANMNVIRVSALCDRVHALRRFILDEYLGFDNVIFLDELMLPFGGVVEYEIAIELGKPMHEELFAEIFGLIET